MDDFSIADTELGSALAAVAVMLVGLVNIAKGENPRMIETVLKAFLAEKNVPAEPEQKPREVKAA